jgi:ABC-type amino acid transport substrate-binding protein
MPGIDTCALRVAVIGLPPLATAGGWGPVLAGSEPSGLGEIGIGDRARLTVCVAIGLALALLLAGIASASSGAVRGSRGASGNPATDKLSLILARGTIVLATDPAYPPQSYQVKGAKRLARTKCAENQFTGNQIAGYDADTSKLVAKSLGVEPCFVAPPWSAMVGGHWGDRWDLAIASIGITYERMAGLYYTQPYSAEAERFFVRKGAPYTSVSQLAGKRLGGCTGCFAEYYIERTLKLPGQPLAYRVKNGTFVGYAVERNGLVDVARGKLPAFLCGVAVGARAINEGLRLRVLGGDQYLAYLSGAVDRFSGLSQVAFTAKVNDIIRRLHERGTLRRLSLHYFHTDFASPAAHFDIASVRQDVR